MTNIELSSSPNKLSVVVLGSAGLGARLQVWSGPSLPVSHSRTQIDKVVYK